MRGATAKPKSRTRGTNIASGNGKQGFEPCMRAAAANAANALRNQNTVVFVELDDVSHCSKGYKVHQRIQTRLSLSVKDAVFAKGERRASST